MEYTLKIKRLKTPTDANWVTTITGGYVEIKGRVYDFSKVKDADKKEDGTVKNSFTDGNGYWKASAEVTGLINPFTNPITNATVTETKIEVSFTDNNGWGSQIPGDNYFEYIVGTCCKKLAERYKSLFGVVVDFSYTKVAEEPKDSTSGTSGTNGTSGTSGDLKKTTTEIPAGTNGSSGTSGTSGESGTSGTSGRNLDGEFTFNIETENAFVNADFGTLFIIGIGEIKEEPLDIPEEESLDEEFQEEGFEGSEELAVEIEKMELLQADSLPNPEPTPESTARVDETKIDYNNPSYVGEKWKSFDIDKLIGAVAKGYGPSSQFKESLKKVLYFIKNDSTINDVRKAAYLLGTAFAESSYSLQRWEADYACKSTGVKYGSGGPCSAALNYYRSTKKKKDYYTLGTDSKGFPYFGRGLIQLTGKANYEKYGTKIGQNLISNGDLAMDPQNSYKIATVYMSGRTFTKVLANDLTGARKSVNGGTNGLSEVNGAYNAWLEAFKKIGAVS